LTTGRRAPRRRPILGAAAMADLWARRHDPLDPDGDPRVMRHRVLVALGVVERKFNINQPRDPHSGEWIDTTPGDGLFNPLGLAVDMVDANDLQPWNDLEDEDKVAALAESMRTDGWRGPPVVVIPGKDYGWGPTSPIAITGSHRIYAAREAGIEVPTVDLDELLGKHGTSLDEIDAQTGADPDDERHIESVIRLDYFLPDDVIEQYGLDAH